MGLSLQDRGCCGATYKLIFIPEMWQEHEYQPPRSGGTAVPPPSRALPYHHFLKLFWRIFVPLFKNLWIDLEILDYRLLVSYKHTPEPQNFKLLGRIFTTHSRSHSLVIQIELILPLDLEN